MHDRASQHIFDPATMEAFAARRRIQLCRELGIRNIILEGDSLEIVTAMRKNEGWRKLTVVLLMKLESSYPLSSPGRSALCVEKGTTWLMVWLV